MEAGKIIQNYRLVKKLGEGGMGEVWLGEHLHMQRKVAIKSLHAQYARNENIKKRFLQEVETLSRLDHPGIVRLYDLVASEDHLCMIMEYVDGLNLEELITQKTGPMNAELLRVLFSQMIEALDYAHKCGVIHRDIKPANFIVTQDNKIKVLDFGIAKVISDETQGMTKTGMRMGTIYYMSPEQIQGVKVDHRTDIYSLGVTLFVMATGKNPLSHMDSEFKVSLAIVSDPLPPAASIYPGVSEKVEKMIAKATAKKPEDRFQSCKEFLTAGPNVVPAPSSIDKAPDKVTVVPLGNAAELTAEQQDERAWKIVMEKRTTTILGHYIERFPNGKYVKEARRRIRIKKNINILLFIFWSYCLIALIGVLTSNSR
jgi:serine/threonine protein kinase